MENFKKVCVVTGASGGIGREIVKKFYDNDFHVVMLDINETALKNTIQEGEYDQARVEYGVLDISNEEQVKKTIGSIVEKNKRIDALVNAAGITGRYDPTIEYSFENFKKIYSVNVFGTFLLMQNVLPTMVEQKSGAIVNIGSVSGMTGYTFEIGYGSSKWAVIGMTKNVANEYGQYGVRANSVSPGWVDTTMFKTSLENYKEFSDAKVTFGPMGRPAEPAEIADAVYFLCSYEARFINGSNLLVDGGMMLG